MATLTDGGTLTLPLPRSLVFFAPNSLDLAESWVYIRDEKRGRRRFCEVLSKSASP